MNRKKIYPMLCAIAFLHFFSACGEKNTEYGSGVPEPRIVVEVSSVTTRVIKEEITSFGSLSFTQKRDITSAVEGTVRKINKEEGQAVKEGEILAVLENLQLSVKRALALSERDSAKAAVRLAESRYQEGRINVEARLIAKEKLILTLEQKGKELESLRTTITNKEQLLKIDGVSEEEVRSLRLSFHSLETEYKNLQKDLEIQQIGFRDSDIRNLGLSIPPDPAARKNLFLSLNTRTLKAEMDLASSKLVAADCGLSAVEFLMAELIITAKNDGVLGRRYIEEGERIAEGTKLFTTFSCSSMYVVFPIQEKDSGILREGQETEVAIPAAGPSLRMGKIEIISPIVDPQSGNLTVKARLLNSDKTLKPGMFATVKVVTGPPKKELALPEEALLSSLEESRPAQVFVVQEERVFLKDIQTGLKSDGMVEVKGGLKNGDIVVIHPAKSLKEGMYVSISL